MNAPFLSINEVSKQLELPAHTLRYWEKQFPATIKPATGAGGRRYYRPETVAALARIKSLLHEHGMTIAGVAKIIKDGKLMTDADHTQIIETVVVEKQVSVIQSTPVLGDIQRAEQLLEMALLELS